MKNIVFRVYYLWFSCKKLHLLKYHILLQKRTVCLCVCQRSHGWTAWPWHPLRTWARILTKRARRRWARQRSGIFICNWYWIVLLLFRWYLIYHFCLSQLISEQHYLVLRAVPLGRPRPLLWEKSGWGGGSVRKEIWGRCFMDLGRRGSNSIWVCRFKFKIPKNTHNFRNKKESGVAGGQIDLSNLRGGGSKIYKNLGPRGLGLNLRWGLPCPRIV